MGGFLACILALGIQAPGTCPSTADVALRLAPLLPPESESSASDSASLDEAADGSLTVSLARSDGEVIASRRLPRAPTCAEQAETVAVTLAVWETRLHSPVSLRLDRLPPVPSSTTVASVVAVPDEDLVARPVEVGSPTSGLSLALGGGVAGGWQPGSWAPGGRLEMMLARPDSPWRGHLSVVGLGAHTTSLPPGQAGWWRTYLAFGADYSIPLGSRFTAVAGAAGAAGLVSIGGSGYLIDHHTWSADWGAEILTRIEWRRGRVRSWFGLALVTWVRHQNLELTAGQTAAVLSRAEPMAALGADFLWGQ
jgi:hypothetical protein